MYLSQMVLVHLFTFSSKTLNMKSFLLKISLFLTLLLLICGIPLIMFEKEAKECYSRAPYNRLNWISNLKNINANLIILGNSRAAGGYNDSILSENMGKKCINCGLAGYPFDYQYHIMYRTYLKSNTSPKYILVDIGPWAFFDYYNEKFIIEMLPYINRKEFDFYIDICPELSSSDKLMLARYSGQMRNVLHELYLFRHPEKDYWNSLKINKWNSNMFTVKNKLEKNKAIIQLFQNFLGECRDRGIKVVLVCSPIHQQDGAKWFDMEGFWKIIHESVSNQETLILDYSDLFENDTTFFIDPMHLNKLGSTNFSIKLAHDLDSLGILQN